MDRLTQIETAFSTLRHTMTGAKDRLGEGLQLTRTQLELLMIIASKPHTTGDLAKRLFLTQGAVTQTVDTLVRRGLVERHPAEHDRRVVLLTLSSDGHELTAHIRKLRHHFIEQLADRLTPEETAALLSITQKLSELIDEKLTKTNH